MSISPDAIELVPKTQVTTLIDLLKEGDALIQDDDVFGAGVEVTAFLIWKYKVKKTLEEICPQVQT